MLSSVDAGLIRLEWFRVPNHRGVEVMVRCLAVLFCTWFGVCWCAYAGGRPAEIRVGVLAFGTVTWELAAIESEGLARAKAIEIVPTRLASPEAAKIALQGNTVDVIVADWIWVARQREQGLDFAFWPYSTSHGALMVPADSAIHSVADLKGKRLGVAGGGIDKNWLLLQALAVSKYGFDLAQDAQVSFGAPPLLNQQLLQGRLDALVNYWNHAAKLEGQGYRQVTDGRAVLRELGITADLANLGYVFRDGWADRNLETWNAYIEVADKARDALCSDEAAWRKVVPLTGETDPNVLGLLRRRYCDGRVKQWGQAELGAAQQAFAILRAVGGEAFAGKSRQLPAGVFWVPRRRP